MQTTNAKGQLAVNKTELRCVELGFVPSRPLYDSRYDLIIDTGNKLLRVQVKYGGGRSSNSAGSSTVKLDYETRKNQVFTYQQDEVDALIVYLPKVDKLCFFEPKVFVGKRKINIRTEAAKNNQKSKIIAAKDYYW